jgi:hypothetical protein
MEILQRGIEKNENRFKELVYKKREEEHFLQEEQEEKWGAKVKRVEPARITTAWNMLEDPLMAIAGSRYRSTEVRNKTFELQQEASSSVLMKGNRKLSKVKVAEAMGAMNPTEEQTKVIAGVLYVLKNLQTIWYNEDEKRVWTMPEDLRLWKKGGRVLWINGKCEEMLEFDKDRVGKWLSEREKEGWKIEWPVSEGGFEEIKAKLASDYPEILVHSQELGKKPKKEDYAKALGRAEAVGILGY